MNKDFFCREYQQLLSRIKSLGDCLEKALSFSDKSRNDLAEFLALDKSAISRLINDSQSLQLAKINEICRFLQNDLIKDYMTYELNKDKINPD
jgi:DNA-binding Xre family transcriptional regulator